MAERNVRGHGSKKIFYPNWVPLHVDVVQKAFAEIGNPRATAIFLVMLAKAYGARAETIDATNADICRWTGLHKSTATASLNRLQALSLIELMDPGVAQSRSNKPRWRIEYADFNPKDEKWVPVPLFFFRDVLRLFPKSALLALLLYYQHLHWRDHCWVGISTLQKRTGWSRSTLYGALKTMSTETEWQQLETGLPNPLAMQWRPGTQGMRRHLTVRFAKYDSEKKTVHLGDGF